VKAAKTAKVKRFKGPKVTLHGEELKRDPIRDKVDEMLSGMRQEFIFARLWPSCALCKKYFMGHTEDDKVRGVQTCWQTCWQGCGWVGGGGGVEPGLRCCAFMGKAGSRFLLGRVWMHTVDCALPLPFC
jgi:hypothetical protein